MNQDGPMTSKTLRVFLAFLAIGVCYLVFNVVRFNRLTLSDHAPLFCQLPASGRVAAMRVVVDPRFIAVDEVKREVRDTRTGFTCGFDELLQIGRECKPVELRHQTTERGFQVSLTALCTTYFIQTSDKRGPRVEAIMGDAYLKESGGRLFDELVRSRSQPTRSGV